MTPPPPPGAQNVTSVSTLFPTVAANLGINPLVLWMVFLGMVLVPVAAFKLPKIMYPLTILGASFFGVSLNILPVWMIILSFLFTVLFFGKEAAGIFRGVPASEPVFERVASTWVQSLYERELPTPASWNCKNCGGPNIEQIKCQYCGMVKE